jgi:hypothetical protein
VTDPFPILWRLDPWSREEAKKLPYVSGHVVVHGGYQWVCAVRVARFDEPGKSGSWMRMGPCLPLGVSVPYGLSALDPENGGIPVAFSYDGSEPAGFELSVTAVTTPWLGPEVVQIVDGEQRMFFHSNPVLGQETVYRVRAFDAYGIRGSWSADLVHDVPLEVLERLDVGAQLLPDLTAGVAWSYPVFDPQDRHDGFEVQYRVDDGEWAAAGSFGTDVFWTTVKMSEKKKYEFRVRGVRSSDGAVSAWSAAPVVVALALAPYSLAVSEVTLPTARIGWEHSGAGALKGFEVRSANGDVVVPVAADQRSAVVPFPRGTAAVEGGYPAVFSVVALLEDVGEAASTGVKVVFPAAPLPVLELGEVTEESVAISWNLASLPGIERFIVSRQLGERASTILRDDVSADASIYIDSDVAAGEVHRYWVRSVATGGRLSGWSSVVQTWVPFPSVAPYGVAAEVVEQGSEFDVHVSWVYDHPCKSFRVDLESGADKSSTVAEGSARGVTLRRSKGSYQVVVTALFDDVEKSNPSAPVQSFLTPLNPPPSVRKVAHYAPSDVLIEWDPVKYCTGYRINVTSTQRPYYWVTDNSWILPGATSVAGYTVKIAAHIGGKSGRIGKEGQIGPGMMGKPFHATPEISVQWGRESGMFFASVTVTYRKELPVKEVLIEFREPGKAAWTTAHTIPPDGTGKLVEKVRPIATGTEFRAGTRYQDGTSDWSVSKQLL